MPKGPNSFGERGFLRERLSGGLRERDSKDARGSNATKEASDDISLRSSRSKSDLTKGTRREGWLGILLRQSSLFEFVKRRNR